MCYKNLSFPLNVYAKLLELDNQPVDYLHFGLFNSKHENVYHAQQHSTELILKQLPPPPCRILEIGIGLGTMQKILTEKGYYCAGMTPDSKQINIASQRLGSKANISCSTFEDFQSDEQFDVIISQESSQYIDRIKLFSKVTQLLKPGGNFILIDEMVLRFTEGNTDTLHHPEHLKSLAQYSGLKLITEQELSQKAGFTMSYLYQQLQKHRGQILTLLKNNEPQLKNLEDTIQKYIDNYNRQQYGYQLFVFNYTGPDKTFDYLQKEHLSDFQKLFQKAFNHPISEILWQWKYKKHPSHSIGYWENKVLTGHYAGFARDILFFGEHKKALQIGDTMVAPEARGRMLKKGVFYQTAHTFLQQFIGYGRPYLLGFGFPNKRVMKLAESLELYHSAGRYTRLHWPAQAIKAHPFFKLRVLSPADQNKVDLLWENSQVDKQNFIIGIRNWERVYYRYLSHPENHYFVLKLVHRITHKLYAVIVLKQTRKQFLLVDFIGQLSAIPVILRAAIRFAWQQDQSSLFSLVSENIKSYFDSFPYTEEDPEISIPHCACTTGPDLNAVYNKWWLMAGDSDFM